MKANEIKDTEVSAKTNRSFRKKGKKQQFGKQERITPKGGNSLQFWNKYPDLLKDASNTLGSHIPGTRMLFESGTKFTPGNVVVVDYAPGVTTTAMGDNPSADTMFSMGSAGNNAVNVQFRKLWLDMHRKYRGIGTYEYADLGIAIIAIVNLFARIASLERIYGLAYSYRSNDRLFPMGILRALGYSNLFIESVFTNLADFRYGINRLIEKCSQLCLPKGLSYLDDQVSLLGFIYRDSKDTRFNTFLYNSDYYVTYAPALFQTGGAVEFFRIENSNWNSYTALLEYVNMCMDTLLTDTDIARMCSDLLAAYKDSGVSKLAIMPEDYHLEPVYDEDTLLKFHNLECPSFVDENDAGVFDPVIVSPIYNGLVNSSSDIISHYQQTAFSGITRDTAYYIYQVDGVIRFTPAIIPTVGAGDVAGITFDTYSNQELHGDSTPVYYMQNDVHHSTHPVASCGDFMIDTWRDEFDVSCVTESVQHKNVLRCLALASSANTAYPAFVTSCSTVIPLRIKAMAITDNNYRDSYELSTSPLDSEMGTAPQYYIVGLGRLSQCDWAPVIKWVDSILPSTGILNGQLITSLNGDLDHVAPISRINIVRIHDASLLSAFKLDIIPAE